MKKTPEFVLLLAIIFIIFSGCAPGANDMVNTPAWNEHVAGFWLGLWHGFIAFFCFVISLFDPRVNVYEIHNNGAFYNLGFIWGSGILFGGGSWFGAKRSD